MFKSKKNKEERKKPLKYRFQFVYVFGESNVGKEREFITKTKKLGKVLVARKINFVYRGGI